MAGVLPSGREQGPTEPGGSSGPGRALPLPAWGRPQGSWTGADATRGDRGKPPEPGRDGAATCRPRGRGSRRRRRHRVRRGLAAADRPPRRHQHPHRRGARALRLADRAPTTSEPGRLVPAVGRRRLGVDRSRSGDPRVGGQPGAAGRRHGAGAGHRGEPRRMGLGPVDPRSPRAPLVPGRATARSRVAGVRRYRRRQRAAGHGGRRARPARRAGRRRRCLPVAALARPAAQRRSARGVDRRRDRRICGCARRARPPLPQGRRCSSAAGALAAPRSSRRGVHLHARGPSRHTVLRARHPPHPAGARLHRRGDPASRACRHPARGVPLGALRRPDRTRRRGLPRRRRDPRPDGPRDPARLLRAGHRPRGPGGEPGAGLAAGARPPCVLRGSGRSGTGVRRGRCPAPGGRDRPGPGARGRPRSPLPGPAAARRRHRDGRPDTSRPGARCPQTGTP